jgi:RNA polymerase sigma factor (sigma-70 family)
VYRYSLAMLHRQADAEDATQTTFMNAYRALERGEHPRDEGKWLRKIALNVCREQYRRAGRRPDEVSLDEDPGELVPEPSTPSIGDVVRGLHCLPFNQRAALVMREFEGRSLAEIATALETSTSAVETLLFRGRRALREQLEEQLTCSEAEEAISRQLDGGLPRRERGRLRAHLRACPDCASLARRLRGQRSAIRALAILPIPASLKLGKLMGGGAASASATATGPSAVSAGGSMIGGLLGSAAAKVALVTVAGGAALGVSYESLHSGLSQPPVRGAAKLAALRQSDRQTAASPAPSAPSAASVMRATDPRVTRTGVPAPRAKRGSVATQSSAPRQWRNGQHSSTTAPASQSALVARGHGRSATNPGQGHLHAAKPSAGSAGSQGSGYAYGQTKPKHTTSTPPSHAYGTVKPKPTKLSTPAPPASGLSLHPPQRPLIPRGQAKKQGAAVISHGRGALK